MPNSDSRLDIRHIFRLVACKINLGAIRIERIYWFGILDHANTLILGLTELHKSPDMAAYCRTTSRVSHSNSSINDDPRATAGKEAGWEPMLKELSIIEPRGRICHAEP